MRRDLLVWLCVSIVAGLAFRSLGDIQDGLSQIAPGVGWTAWHVIGWGARDFWQVTIIFACAIHAVSKSGIYSKTAIAYIAITLIVNAIVSFFWHDRLYRWSVENRHWFNW
jgi:putative copper export protein